jgi:hypothetical protein
MVNVFILEMEKNSVIFTSDFLKIRKKQKTYKLCIKVYSNFTAIIESKYMTSELFKLNTVIHILVIEKITITLKSCF